MLIGPPTDGDFDVSLPNEDIVGPVNRKAAFKR